MMVAQDTESSGAVELSVVDTSPKSRGDLEASRSARLIQGVVRLPSELAKVIVSILRQRPDVIHLNTSGQFALARDLAVGHLCTLFRIPLVYHIRFGRLPEARAANTWEWRLFSRAARRATTVVAIDAITEDAVAGLGHGNVMRIPNFVDVNAIIPPPDIAREQVCLFVGWLIESKGVLELLRAWKELAPPGWRLDLVGPIDDGFLQRLGGEELPESVVVSGPKDHDEVVARMQASALFVFPSHTEGFPNAVAEAMAAGMPILASGVGAIPEMLQDGAGVVIPPRDADELRRQLSLLIADETKRAALGRRARERVNECYSKESVMARYVAEWARVSGVEPGARRRAG